MWWRGKQKEGLTVQERTSFAIGQDISKGVPNNWLGASWKAYMEEKG
jgi:hypothetical protein